MNLEGCVCVCVCVVAVACLRADSLLQQRITIQLPTVSFLVQFQTLSQAISPMLSPIVSIILH